MTSPRKPRVGFDNSGHISPADAKRLLELGREGREQDAEAFVESDTSTDDLAEELAEAAVAEMNSGEAELTSELQAEVEEDRGGPFTETSANTEFAGGTDESNIADATREPFPTANATDEEDEAATTK